MHEKDERNELIEERVQVNAREEHYWLRGSEEGRSLEMGNLHLVVSGGDVPILDAQEEVDDDPILRPVLRGEELDHYGGKLEEISARGQRLAGPGRPVDVLEGDRTEMVNV